MTTDHAIAVISQPGRFSVRDVRFACDAIIKSDQPAHIINQAHVVRWAHTTAND